MDKYICVVCNYIYNPEEGDPAHGIPAGTPWEQVSEDWVCPWCQLGKEYFEKHDR
ncbi:MAG: rubredoxin [Eubacterium sp.]